MKTVVNEVRVSKYKLINQNRTNEGKYELNEKSSDYGKLADIKKYV